jgi:uncharacterized protein
LTRYEILRVAMSGDNIEIVREVYYAWSESDVGRALQQIDSDIVWVAIADAPDAGTYRGHPGVRAYMEDWIENFDNLGVEFKDVVDGDKRLVATQRATAKGKGSGLESELHYAVAYWFRDGKIVAIKEFRTKEEALEAAELQT